MADGAVMMAILTGVGRPYVARAGSCGTPLHAVPEREGWNGLPTLMTETPTTRINNTRPPAAWGSLWRVVENQAHNALNDKVAQFILLAVSQVLAVSAYYPQIIAALLVLPQLFFAPMAGWLSDRLSKRRLIVWCSLSQTLLLLLISVSFYVHQFWIATALFFGLALQAAVFGPAKTGIVKELVGERHLTMANSWMQMTVILAIAGGQLLGGKAFEYYHDNVFNRDPWMAATAPMLLLAALSLLPLLFASQVKPTDSHCEEKFRAKLFTEHFTHLDDLVRKKHLFLPALGVSFFWLAATMVMLMLIEMAAVVEPNAAARAGLSSEFLLLVAVGVTVGSVLTGWLSANKIELGLVPLGSVAMAAGCVLCAIVPPGGFLFCALLVLIGIGSALFMVPLSAYLQDKVEPHVRGRILAAAGLLDSLGMMFGILLQLLLMKLGVGIHGQFVALSILCIVTAAYVLRIIPQNFIRFLVLSFVKVVYRVRVLHGHRIPETGGVLMVSNHVSYIDALIISAACERQVRFTAFDEFFKHRLLSFPLRMFGVVPISNRRAKDAIVALSDALRAGDVVCIFPEGQLTRTGMMNEIRKGFELIARRGGAPVQPVCLDGLWGSIFSFERGRFFSKHPHHFPYHLNVVYGEPIPAAEASAEKCREAFQALAAEGLMGRGQVRRGLAIALASSLCRDPWRPAVLEAHPVERQVRRGELFGRAMQLARKWKSFPAERIGIVLPASLDAITANAALVFAGKVPVNIAPEAAASPGALHELMQQEGITSVVTSVSTRAALPQFPWPDHVLAVEAELEEVDELYLLADTGIAWLAPRFTLHWWMPRWRASGGSGYIFQGPDGPCFSFVDGRGVLAQVEMLRGTHLLHDRDRLLCGAPYSSAAGSLIGLWSSLLRGQPVLPLPSGLGETDFANAVARMDGTLALGDAAFAERLCRASREDQRTLRAFLQIGHVAASPPSPETLVCPLLTGESEGVLLAISMPHPPALTSTAEPQNGWMEGSYGRLLPGVRAAVTDYGVILTSPGATKDSLLPPRTRIDDEGFVFLPAKAAPLNGPDAG